MRNPSTPTPDRDLMARVTLEYQLSVPLDDDASWNVLWWRVEAAVSTSPSAVRNLVRAAFWHEMAERGL